MLAYAALSKLPEGLRKPLLEEYSRILNNFYSHNWLMSELSAGRFSEIVYTILDGFANEGSYAREPSKPTDMVKACKQLENRIKDPRSFKILIPRLLPGLYEIRNNRNVGHVGGEVDPNHMDCSLVVSITSWIMAELVRVFHSLNTSEAQIVIDQLTEFKIPLVWKSEKGIRRVLDTSKSTRDKILLLLSSCSQRVTSGDLLAWTEYKNKTNFNKILDKLHSERLIEYSPKDETVVLLPLGLQEINLKVLIY